MNSTVVIVTYNRLPLLKECIQCIENQDKQFNNVVIVDNASTDGTSSFLNNYKEKYYILTESENGGGAKGFMDGVKYIHENLKTDWVLLIDDDAMLCNNYLSTLVRYVLKYPKIKAFSGSIMTDGKIDVTHRKVLKNCLSFNIKPVPLVSYQKDFFMCDLATFCGLFFDAKLINVIGYPKGDYFIWYDDTEYSLRIGRYSQIMNVNSISINHKTKLGTSNNKLNWRGYYGIRNRGDVIRQYGTFYQYILFRMEITKSMILNLVASWFIKNRNYHYNYCLYRDALYDMKKGIFGFNPKYCYEK